MVWHGRTDSMWWNLMLVVVLHMHTPHTLYLHPEPVVLYSSEYHHGCSVVWYQSVYLWVTEYTTSLYQHTMPQ